jgi:PTH1 family peptidyl-tRNA hydrolase
MNCSGEALAAIDPGRTFEPSCVLVVVDDLALPAGRLRLRAGGSDGGHRGLRSIEQQLGTAGYPRLRIGVGGTPEGRETKEFVLEAPTATEQELIDRAVAEAVHGMVAWLDSTPLPTLMNRLNGAEKTEPPPGGSDRHRD